LAKPLGLCSEAVTLLHENKLFLLQIRRDYHSLVDQRMASRQAKQEFLAEEVLDPNPRIGSGIADQSEIEFVFLKAP
jgi:hypothetical protein